MRTEVLSKGGIFVEMSKSEDNVAVGVGACAASYEVNILVTQGSTTGDGDSDVSVPKSSTGTGNCPIVVATSLPPVPLGPTSPSSIGPTCSILSPSLTSSSTLSLHCTDSGATSSCPNSISSHPITC